MFENKHPVFYIAYIAPQLSVSLDFNALDTYTTDLLTVKLYKNIK